MWTIEKGAFHLNCLELKAAFFALKSFCKDLSNCTVLLQTAVLLSHAPITRVEQRPTYMRLPEKFGFGVCPLITLWLHLINTEADLESKVDKYLI